MDLEINTFEWETLRNRMILTIFEVLFITEEIGVGGIICE